MAIYYVKTGGSDGLDGLSEANAWATIAKVNGFTFAAGDSILFRRGDVWREELIVPRSGAAGTPMIFGAWGSGALPKISGADVFTGWTAAGTTPVLVQSWASSGGATSPLAKVYAATPTEGNLLVAIGYAAGSAIANGDISGWTLATSTIPNSAGGVGIWYKVAGAAESSTVTLTWSGTPGSLILHIAEYTGIDTLDQIANVDNTGGSVTSRSSGTTPTTTAADELCIAAVGVGAAITAESWNNSFVSRRDSTFACIVADRFVTTTGTYETTASWTTARLAGGLIATFKASGGGQANTWQVACSTEPKVVLFDGHYGYRQATLGAVNSEFDWYWASPSGPLNIYATSDPDSAYSTIEASQRWRASSAEVSRSYITFQDLELTTASRYGFIPYEGAPCDHITFQRCAFTNNGSTGVMIQNNDLQSDYLIENCNSSRNGCYGVRTNRFIQNFTVRGLTSYRDGIVEDDWEDFAGSHDESAGIKIWCNAVAGDYNILIENCDISYVAYRDDGWFPPEYATKPRGHGIWLDTVYATTPTLVCAEVRLNRAYNCRRSGLFVEKVSYTQWHHNLLFNNAEFGIRFETQSPFTSTVFENLVAHNVCYGNLINIQCQGSTGVTPSFYDNTVQNNICFAAAGTGHKEFSATDGAQNDGTYGSGNVYTYNCFGTEYTDFIRWGATSYSTYAAWNAAGGAGAGVTDNYVNGDPLFVNAAAADFRLTVLSPARNAGVAIAGINDGYVGSAPDMGAYEFAIGGTSGGRLWNLLGCTWRGFR